MVAYSNITISAPSGTSQHGRPEIICYPSTWKTVIIFFLINYVAHCFTTWRRPGEKTAEYLFSSFLALIFPVSGLGRGLEAIYRHASWQGSFKDFAKGTIGLGSMKYELQKAGKAGALCVVERYLRDPIGDLEYSSSFYAHNRQHWDLPGAFILGASSASPNELVEIVLGDENDGHEKLDDLLNTREISGVAMIQAVSPYHIVELPASSIANIRLEGRGQYSLSILSSLLVTKKNRLEPQESDYERHEHVNFVFAQSSNTFQILLAIAQIVYSSYTLARRTGDQFQLFGYSSFSITVVPYLTMSFINLLGNLLTPSYPGLYLVKTSVMEEAQSRGNLFQGHVTSLDDEHLHQEKQAKGHFHQDEEYGKHRIPQQHMYKVIPCDQPRPPTPSGEANINLSVSDSTTAALKTNELQIIRVCFCPRVDDEIRRCQETPTSTITVLTGQPLKIDTDKRTMFFIIGWLLAIVAPLPLIIYHGIANSDKGSPFQKVTIILWIITGDLLGTYILASHPNLKVVYLGFKDIIKSVLVSASGETLNEDAKKTKSYAHKIWSVYLMFLVMIFIGLAVAGMNFHTVITQILAFGDCMHMPT